MNLATLTADIADWTGHSFTEPRMATIIRLMEADVTREVRVQAMMATDDHFPIYDRHERVPDGFIQPVRFALDRDHGEMTYYAPADFYAQPEYRQTGVPTIYTREGDYFVFAPEPQEENMGMLSYLRAFPPLENDDDTNWLLTHHYSIPLYYALAHAFSFVQDDEQARKYGVLAQSLVDALNVKDQLAAFPLNQAARRSMNRP